MTSIRPATDDDAGVIARVWHEAWGDGHTGHVPDGLLAHRRPAHFAGRAAERVDRSWVAEVDGEVVGFVTVEGDELEQIFVLSSARGTGVAADLLRTGTDAIGAAGHDVAWLAVVAGNARARAFYERRGWVDAGPLAYEAGTDDGTFVVPCRRYEVALRSTTAPSFLGAAPDGEGARRLYAEDIEGDGYVMNLSRVWAHAPDLQDGVSAVLDRAVEVGGLTFRQRGVLVTATAATRGDAYCALAWGTRLAGEVGATAAAAVIAGDDTGLDPADAALARWARMVATDPNGTVAADVEELRAVGLDDAQILAATVFVALRLAFSTVNDALGALPDAELAAAAPDEVRASVAFGRPPAG